MSITKEEKQLLAKAMNQILEHPETWDQTVWHCGTSHCFGGWVQIFGGHKESDTVIASMRELLPNVSENDVFWVTDSDRTIPELYRWVYFMVHIDDTLTPIEVPE